MEKYGPAQQPTRNGNRQCSVSALAYNSIGPQKQNDFKRPENTQWQKNADIKNILQPSSDSSCSPQFSGKNSVDAQSFLFERHLSEHIFWSDIVKLQLLV